MSQKLPRSFGRYLLKKLIARGGMGEIYLAETEGVGGVAKTCAIKRLPPGMVYDEDFIQRFLDEARVVTTLSHGNIAHVYEVAQEKGEFFLAMEYINGRDLRQVLARCFEKRVQVPIDLALYIIKELLRGLSYAHRKESQDGMPLGLIHRDVCPQNIMISFEGEVKLIDFGLAKSALKSLATNPSILLGKVAYMSPEQARRQKLDRRSDLYSAGVVLYETLSGERRYGNKKGPALLNVVREPKPLQISAANEFPPVIQKVLEKALQIAPENRYQNAEEFRKDISFAINTLKHSVEPERLGDFVKALFRTQTPAKPARPKTLQNGTENGEGLSGVTNPQISTLPASTSDTPSFLNTPESQEDKESLAQLLSSPSPARGFSSTDPLSIEPTAISTPQPSLHSFADNPPPIHALADNPPPMPSLFQEEIERDREFEKSLSAIASEELGEPTSVTPLPLPHLMEPSARQNDSLVFKEFPAETDDNKPHDNVSEEMSFTPSTMVSQTTPSPETPAPHITQNKNIPANPSTAVVPYPKPELHSFQKKQPGRGLRIFLVTLLGIFLLGVLGGLVAFLVDPEGFKSWTNLFSTPKVQVEVSPPSSNSLPTETPEEKSVEPDTKPGALSQPAQSLGAIAAKESKQALDQALEKKHLLIADIPGLEEIYEEIENSAAINDLASIEEHQNTGEALIAKTILSKRLVRKKYDRILKETRKNRIEKNAKVSKLLRKIRRERSIVQKNNLLNELNTYLQNL